MLKVQETRRIALNMAVLIPFQKSGRDRVEAALRTLAERMTHTQMELARLRAWADVLEAGLAGSTSLDGEWTGTAFSSFEQSHQEGETASLLRSRSQRKGRDRTSSATSNSGHAASQYLDRPPIPHRTSSASFHTAWEREVASPEAESGSSTLPDTKGTDLQPEEGTVDEPEDWQSMLQGDEHHRRHLAEVPEEGLRKLSLRMKGELPE